MRKLEVFFTAGERRTFEGVPDSAVISFKDGILKVWKGPNNSDLIAIFSGVTSFFDSSLISMPPWGVKKNDWLEGEEVPGDPFTQYLNHIVPAPPKM